MFFDFDESLGKLNGMVESVKCFLYRKIGRIDKNYLISDNF